MSEVRRLGILIVCWLLSLTITHQQTVYVSTTVQSSTVSGPSGIEKEVLGPLRVWHIVAIVCSLVLTGLVILCYCYDYRIPRSRTEIAENHKKRQMNKKYLFILEKRPEDVLTKPKEPTQQPTHARAVAPSNARAHASSTVKPPALNKAHNAKTEALNKVRNAVRATSLQKPSTAAGHTRSSTATGHTRSSRSSDEPDYFTSAVRPRPKTGIETPLASHPKDLLSLMNQVKKKTTTERRA